MNSEAYDKAYDKARQFFSEKFEKTYQSVSISQNKNTELGGHLSKHIWKGVKEKKVSFFEEFRDVGKLFRNWQKHQNIIWPDNNRQQYTIFYKTKFQGRNQSGLKLDFRAVTWVFEKKNGQWIVSTAFPEQA